ncbi:Hypothetical protein PBC10988_2510 [Planctomycetales bacterium 10988]|nr:Hypothetical protein PBC10988_2510 [Planctomycetales bacterium 10988]
MVTNVQEELRLDDGTRKILFHPCFPNTCLVEEATHYTFDFCQKKAPYGEFSINQWWMDRKTLYPDRGNRTKTNYEPIIRYWWALCRRHRTNEQKDILENFILVRLLPYIRSNGAKDVFQDAVPPQKNVEGISRQAFIFQLDQMLQASRDQELDWVQFHHRTADCLGPPEYDLEINELYNQFCKELFEEGRQAIERYGKDGIIIAERKWTQWLNFFSRRKGHEQEKKVLDILSYECRAAFHQCYSAVWCELLRALDKKYNWSDEEYYFHRIWHTELRLPSDRPEESYFHLFHGHVFGLHPAAADFISTQTGAEMVGDVLKGEDDQPFRRMLHGLLVAIHAYQDRRETYADSRRNASSKPVF